MLTINSVLPGMEFTLTSPLCRLITFFTISSPIPVPSPTFFVVKKGSNILDRISLGIPVPLSVIFTVIFFLKRHKLHYQLNLSRPGLIPQYKLQPLSYHHRNFF